MLMHFHIDLNHFYQLNSLEVGYLVQLKLNEKARFPVRKIAMEHYNKARLTLPRVQPCIFCGVVGCSTSHLVLSSSSSEDEE